MSEQQVEPSEAEQRLARRGEQLITAYDRIRTLSRKDADVGLGGRLVVEAFHTLYHESGREGRCRWLGIPMWKTPQDLFVLQEILVETTPDLVVELGSGQGGSALFCATVMDVLDRGRVLSIDVEALVRPRHPRVTFVVGDSNDPDVTNRVRREAEGVERVMVVLDSSHRRDHVLQELRSYAALVTAGCYLLVEDTCLNGHPIEPHYGPGPAEALDEFLLDRPDMFVTDQSREKFMMTYHPGGFLRRTDLDA